MGILDKLFGAKKEIELNQIDGLCMPDFSKEFKRCKVVTVKMNEDGSCTLVKDPMKEIKKEVWDGLTEPARNELINKGFYPEGDGAPGQVIIEP